MARSPDGLTKPVKNMKHGRWSNDVEKYIAWKDLEKQFIKGMTPFSIK